MHELLLITHVDNGFLLVALSIIASGLPSPYREATTNVVCSMLPLISDTRYASLQYIESSPHCVCNTGAGRSELGPCAESS